MKLVFPGGEHPQVLLGPGINRVGSDPGANIVIDHPGIRPRHCELRVTAHGVVLQVPPGEKVRVNDRDVDGVISLRPGDVVAFDRIRARLASIEAAMPVPHLPKFVGNVEPANDDPGATAVRQVLPRYVLRGISGEGFGRSYPVIGITTLGRSQDCSLHIEQPGLSRQHARLTPMDKGLLIEDLGSTNGCFVKGKRLQRALAAPGDEIAFGILRFHLVSPGQGEPVQVVARTVTRRNPGKPLPTWWVVAGMVLGLTAICLMAWLQ